MIARHVGAGLAALALSVAGLVIAAPAQAASCTSTPGVSVVVDYGGGSIANGCAAGTPGSGLAALTKAGFSYTFAPRVPGFVCTINGTPGDQNCMKPDYWSYWHASPGGSWVYYTTGAGSSHPKPGQVEGWAFGSGQPPSEAPPATMAPPAKPKPSPSPTPKPTPRPVQKTQSAAASPTKATASAKRSGKASKAASATSSSKPSAPATPTHTASAQAGGSPTPATTGVGQPPTSTQLPTSSASGSGLSWWWGVGVLALLGVAGTGAAYSRRRS